MTDPYPRIVDPTVFGKVAVLMGGRSSEREISLMTGQAVLEALKRLNVDAVGFDTGRTAISELATRNFDRAWIALHGYGGEDGTVQGALELMDIAYTGSSVLGSALSMDKLRSKRLFRACGLRTPKFSVIRSEKDFDRVVDELRLPLIVKPASHGSSIGLTRVEDVDEMAAAFSRAQEYDNCVFAEEWLTGKEYTASVLADEALPLIRIDAANTFYDYQAKYFSDETKYFCPAGLASADETRFSRASLEAFRAVGAGGWGRVDFLIDRDGEPSFLEVNTVPGMTSHSLVPMAASERGIGFAELAWRILETSFVQRYRGESK